MAVLLLALTETHPLIPRAISVYRWRFDETETLKKVFKIPRLLFLYFRSKAKKVSRAHGIGRHSMEELLEILDEDLKALSDFIGKIGFVKASKTFQPNIILHQISLTATDSMEKKEVLTRSYVKSPCTNWK